MKKALLILLATVSLSASAKDFCIDLRFEGGSYICRKEFAELQASVATDNYSKAWFAHSDCIDDYLALCRDIRPTTNKAGLCDELQLRGQDYLCNEESDPKKQAACLKKFVKSCKSIKGVFPY